MKCKTCGLNISILQKGYCDECRKFFSPRKKMIEELKEEFHWSKIKDGSGAWSPGECAIKIDKWFTKGKQGDQYEK